MSIVCRIDITEDEWRELRVLALRLNTGVPGLLAELVRAKLVKAQERRAS